MTRLEEIKARNEKHRAGCVRSGRAPCETCQDHAYCVTGADVPWLVERVERLEKLAAAVWDFTQERNVGALDVAYWNYEAGVMQAELEEPAASEERA